MFIKIIAKLKCNRGQVGATPAAVETVKSGAGEKSSQNNANNKLEGLIADIDLSDVAENIREDVKKKLTEKVKLYDSGFRGKSEILSQKLKELENSEASLKELKDLKNEISGNPELEKRITRLINDARSGKLDEADSKKTIDKLIENAETKEEIRTLEQLKKVVNEASVSEEKIQALERRLALIEGDFNLSQTDRVVSKIEELKGDFGKEIVDKYAAKIKDAMLRNPNLTAKKVLYHFADDNEIDEAILEKNKRKIERELKRKEEGSFQNNGQNVRTPLVLNRDPKTKKVGYKDIIRQVKTSVGFG